MSCFDVPRRQFVAWFGEGAKGSAEDNAVAATIEKQSAEGFRAYRRELQIRFDPVRRIAWLPRRDGKACCTDHVSLWNNSAGGADDVFVVVADTESEAVTALEEVRPR